MASSGTSSDRSYASRYDDPASCHGSVTLTTQSRAFGTHQVSSHLSSHWLLYGTVGWHVLDSWIGKATATSAFLY